MVNLDKEPLKKTNGSRMPPATDIEIVVKQNDEDTKPTEKAPKAFGGLDLGEWCEIIFTTLLIAAIIGAFIWILTGFLGEGLQLSRHLITGG